MKTRPIPAIVMLIAGFIACILGIINHYELVDFIRTVLISMIIFLVIGFMVKIVLDHTLEKMADKVDELDEQTKDDEIASENTDKSVESDGDDEK